MKEIYSNCYENYRPMINGFVQCQHLPVQLVLEKIDRKTKLRATSGTIICPQVEKLTWLAQVKGDPLSY